MTARWSRIRLSYHAACPNCGGPVSSDRLEKGLPCQRCLPEEPDIPGNADYYNLVETIGEQLARNGRLAGYSLLYASVKEMKNFESFFKAIVGRRPWSAQRTWARRLLQHESLAIVAPTGVGKTTLLQVYALYRIREGAKVYYLLPTENLVAQVASKLEAYAGKAGIDARIVSYRSSLPKNKREEVLAAIQRGDYDALVTTTSFLSRRWELLQSKNFDLVIVDDVDSVLRNSKNIDKLLMLLGFSQETIAKAYMLIKKKLEAVAAKATGRTKLYSALLEDIRQLEAELSSALVAEAKGQLVIASATGRVRGLKPKLFRELLGFEIGHVYDHTRSMANFKYIVAGDLLATTLKIVEKLGPGGLVFVSKRYGKGIARRLAEELNNRGIRAGVALAGRRVLERFERGELDVLVGIASYYGVIVRGIDMPQRIIYTVFMGVPSNSIRLEKSMYTPFSIVRAALELGYPEAEDLAKAVAKLSHGEQVALRIALANNEELEGRLEELLRRLREARAWLIHEIRRKACSSGQLRLAGSLYVCSNGEIHVITPDAATYVQASGRASRMLGSKMTHGVSIVIDNHEELVDLLEEKLKRFIENASFEPLDWRRIDEEIEKARKSRIGLGRDVNIETSLIIFESPTKAKTVASFFGRPVRRKIGSLTVYETTFLNPISGKIHVAVLAASTGHLYDLSVDDEGLYGVEIDGGTVEPIYKPIKRCLSCGHQFSSSSSLCPRCGSANIATKEDIVAALRELASEVEMVYIATDPDIEGEKIAYDLYVLLRPYAASVKRIELHEITKSELMRALASPRSINKRMVEAQVLRRIEDRWIGFALSQHLWGVFGKNWLGAGRVQTPVLGWVIDRYREWREKLGYNLYLKLPGTRLRIHFEDADRARKAAETVTSKGLLVIDAEETVEEVTPPPPFTTETLIYEASRRLGYPAAKTMRVAQELFEAGLITYHRTDSTHVSTAGMGIAKAYLEDKGLVEYYKPRPWGPPGHHEAIRPTRPVDAETLRRQIAAGYTKTTITMRESHFRLYDLIFRRFVASQMKPARLVKKRLRLVIPAEEPIYVALEAYVGIVEQGYTSVYQQPAIDRTLGAASPGTVIKAEKAVLRRGSEIQLYSHGDLVVLMKRRGLGRPSTYARTIDAIIRHGYVVESRYRRKLVPTKLGIEVYEYLVSNYGSLVSEERTRQLMEEIEQIVAGKVDALHVLDELYVELEQLLLASRREDVSQEVA